MHTLKKVSAAVAIAMSAGVTQAAIIDGTNEPGELFVSVWDATAQLSYHLDLGITTAQLLANPSQTLVFDLFGDANYAGFLSPQSPLVFNIAGTDKVLGDLPDVPDFGLLVTSNDNVGSAIAGSWDSSTINSNGGNIVVHSNALNAVDAAGTCDPGSANCSAIAGPTDGNAYHGANTWLSNFGGGLPFGNTAGVDTALGFWHLGTDENGSVAIATQLPNDWILTGAGKLCYGGTECSAPSQVPVPAAVWLFGSGLVGLVGIARRKAMAAA